MRAPLLLQLVAAKFAIESLQALQDGAYVVRLDPEGTEMSKPSVDAEAARASRYLYVGCHQTETLAITKDAQLEDPVTGRAVYDPNACVLYCLNTNPEADPGTIVAAVSQDRCGCVVKSRIREVFKEVDTRFCDVSCPLYANELCGGAPNYWGVFRDYDKVTLSGQGAYDPWRYIFFTVVMVEEPGDRDLETVPERYYLHAMSTSTGMALFEFQMKLAGILYGLQYDLDSTRLISLYIDAITARIEVRDWSYKLSTIIVNTSDYGCGQMVVTLPRVRMQMSTSTMFREAKTEFLRTDIFDTLPYPLEFLSFTGASAIISKDGSDSFVFAQIEGQPNHMKDRMFVVDIGSYGEAGGLVLRDEPLDFKVLQFLTNEKWGDISAVGPRTKIGMSGPVQQYIYMGRVYKSEEMDKKMVDWMFSELAPMLLTEDGVIDDYWFYPAVSCSEHLYRKSMLAYKALPDEGSWADVPITILQVDLNDETQKEWWGENGSIPVDVPYAPIYNREPRIPLSLAAPALLEARFDMEAGSIIVQFDQPTLKGAKPEDSNCDIVPDFVDYSYEMNGLVSCSLIFNEATLIKLGDPELLNCEWPASETVQINLGKGFTVESGDSIFVKEDTIYTQPRDGEYSMASSGGVLVEPPILEVEVEENGVIVTQVLSPEIIVTGNTRIDECSPVKLSASDTFRTGGRPVYAWTLKSYEDLTNRPDRIFDDTKLSTVGEKLEHATGANLAILDLSPFDLETSTLYNIQLDVTSRWGLTSTRVIEVTKLNFPAPMVQILGQSVQATNRTSTLSLLAVGIPSACSGVERRLGFRWTETSGIINFADYPDIQRLSKTLVIPPFVLEPEKTYNFTVECFVYSEPTKVSSASVMVEVKRSPVFVVLGSLRAARESRMMTRGNVLVLDARESQDPDYPTQEGHTFKGTFRWFCTDPNQQSCFGGITSELMDLSDKICRTDPNTKLVDGGKLFSAPLFDNLEYCRYARGVIMTKTADLVVGKYRFSVEIRSYDGRTAMKQIEIELTEEQIPSVTLQIQGEPTGKYAVSNDIKISGTIEGDTDTEQLEITYGWDVYTYQLNPDYDADQAREQGATYLVDQRRFVLSRNYQTSDASRFTASPENPTLIILQNVLQPSTTYKFRLLINVGQVQGYSDITLETAGLAPRGGSLSVEPMLGDMTVPRLYTAPDWIADDTPLTYWFGYIDEGQSDGEGGAVEIKLSADAVPIAQLEIPQFSIMGPADDDFRVMAFVHVSTPYGAKTTMYLNISVKPPADIDGFVNNQMQAALDADGESALGNLAAVLSVSSMGSDQPDPALLNDVLDIVAAKSGTAPRTQQNTEQTFQVLKQVSNGGMKSLRVMDAFEDTINAAAEAGHFGPNSAATTLAFDVMGSLLPDVNPTGDAATGLSHTIFGSWRANPNFEARMMAAQSASRSHVAYNGNTPVRSPPHHPIPTPPQYVIQDCYEPFCDVLGLRCVRRGPLGLENMLCCDEENLQYICRDPPCWHRGPGCPSQRKHHPRRLEESATSVATSSRINDNDKDWFTPWSYRWRRGKTYDKREIASDHHVGETWNEWHRSDFSYGPGHAQGTPRRLGFSIPFNRTEAQFDILEQDEVPLLESARKLTRKRDARKMDILLQESKFEAEFGMMEPDRAMKLRKQFFKDRLRQEEDKLEDDRKVSQMITRVAVTRDTVVKKLIAKMVSNEQNFMRKTDGFTIWVGKRTNMSNVHPMFVFPKKYIVPPDSPDDPTPYNALTGFSFEYIEYTKNVYGWAASAPASSQSVLITLIVMKANPEVDLLVYNEKEPIRTFADIAMPASAICMYWDRFAPGTAGGAWSGKGIINDGRGCLTTHLSDMGIFIDGRMPTQMLVDSVTEAPSANVIDHRNIAVCAYLGFVVVFGLVAVTWGFKTDEKVREDQRLGRVGAPQFWLDGDGLTTPLSVADPIAYRKVKDRTAFLLQTFLNVVEREHVLLGAIFYSETFTRPQRLMCVVALTTGIMATNAAIYGQPYSFAVSEQFVASGILSSLIMFPVYCMLFIMFTIRPVQLKKVLIKRRYRNADVQRIEQALHAAEREANLAPPGAPIQTGSPYRPLVGGLPALPPVPTQALPVGGMTMPGVPAGMALPDAPPPPQYPPPQAQKPPPQALLPPIYFGRAPMPVAAGGNTTRPPPPPRQKPLPARPANTPPATPKGMPQLPPRGTPPGTPPATPPVTDSEARGLPGMPDPTHAMAPPGMNTTPRFVPHTPTGVPPIMPPVPGPLQVGYGAGALVPAGQPPPGLPAPHIPPANALAMAPAPPTQPTMLPAPPPPPREDDQAFVRRVRLVYLDRVTREHQKLELLEQPDTGKPLPSWAHTVGAAIPYTAASIFTATSVFIVVAFGFKFSSETEQRWLAASLIGLATVMGVLDVIRIFMVTIVELRKFEVRQRSRAGELMERRIKKEGDDDLPSILKPKPKKKIIPTPPIPTMAPRAPMRPQRAAVGAGPALEGNKPPELGNAPDVTAGSQQLPVGAGLPPPAPAVADGRVPPLRVPGHAGTPTLGTPTRAPSPDLKPVNSLSGALNDSLKQRASGAPPPPPPAPGVPTGGTPVSGRSPRSRSPRGTPTGPPPLSGQVASGPGSARGPGQIPPSPSGSVPRAPPSPAGSAKSGASASMAEARRRAREGGR